MSAIKQYLAAIGRRGGIRSRRTLDPAIARRMVAIREARRIAQRANTTTRLGGTAADTSASAQAIQDDLIRRGSPGEKLARVARLSRMVDQLAMAGLRQRHPTVDDEVIRDLRAELRLGRELASRVSGARRDIA